MSSALLRKLSAFGDLNNTEIALLDELTASVRTTTAKRAIISDGERPESVHLIVHGWAARVRILPGGARQITAFLIPGDFCDLHAKILGHMDHSIVALTSCSVAWVPSDKLDELTAEHTGLTRALWWGTLLDESIVRNWVVNIGQRDAYARIANLLCEMHARMSIVGLVEADRLDFPVTQEELGNATGVTAVHVNRTLQRLRAAELIELSARSLKIVNYTGLAQAGGFDPSYLHLNRRIQ